MLEVQCASMPLIDMSQICAACQKSDDLGGPVCRDLGAHIDGFVATAAHSLVVQADEDAAVTGKAADVIAAANTGLEAALRLIRPGKKISDVSPASPMSAPAASHSCRMTAHVLCKQKAITHVSCSHHPLGCADSYDEEGLRHLTSASCLHSALPGF